MRSSFGALLISLTVGAAILPADVTIRYKTEAKSSMPMAASVATALSSTSVIYMKGNQGVTTSGDLRTLVDFVRQEVTFMDTARKQYATFPAAQFGTKMSGAMPQMPQAATDVLNSIKTTVDSKKTGQSESILGVQAEEREIVFTMELPIPGETKAPAMSMRMVIRTWTPAAGEALRVPAIRQLTGFGLWTKYFMNPMEMIGKFAPKGFTSLVDEMQKDQSAMLRMNMDIYMSAPLPGLSADPTAPLMQMNMEITELSADPVDGKLFEIPADFTASTAEEILKTATQKRTTGVWTETH